MTSSIKPEVHNITTLPEEDRRTAIGNMHKKFVKIGRRCDRGQTDTHTQTDTLITILRSPIGGGVIIGLVGCFCVLCVSRSEYCRNVKLKYCLVSDAPWAKAFREKLAKQPSEGGFTGSLH